MKAPACFGSPVVVSHLCETCRSCSFVFSCLNQAESMLSRFADTETASRERQRLALSRQALTSSPSESVGAGGSIKRATLSSEQENALSRLGKATSSLSRQLLEKGWFEFARSEMRAGRNPGKKGWQQILCDFLIQGGVSRGDLQLAYQEQLNLTPGSARVRVSKAVSVFFAGRLIIETNNKIVLAGN